MDRKIIIPVLTFKLSVGQDQDQATKATMCEKMTMEDILWVGSFRHGVRMKLNINIKLKMCHSHFTIWSHEQRLG